MKPLCKYCGLRADTVTFGICTECIEALARRHAEREQKRVSRAAYIREWRRKNADRRAEYNRRYYLSHRQERLEANRRWRQENAGRKAELNRTYREAHREEARAYSRAYYWAHREECLARKRVYRQKKEARAMSEQTWSDGFTDIYRADFSWFDEYLFPDGFVLRRFEQPGGEAHYYGRQVDWWEYICMPTAEGEDVDWIVIDPDERNYIVQVREDWENDER
jgi:hypothetical protein